MYRLTIRIDRVLGPDRIRPRGSTQEEKTTSELALVITTLNWLEAVNKAIRVLTSEQGDMMANQQAPARLIDDDEEEED